MLNPNSKALKTMFAACALVLTVGLAACGRQQAQPTEPAQTEQTATQEPQATTTDGAPTQTRNDAYIAEAEARHIALSHAGLTEADCAELEVELVLDEAVPHYDVDFKAKGMEYDYDIDAVTGEVINYKSEADD